MKRFDDEEFHMWGDFVFGITDEDIEKLKQGKTLYGDVNDEFVVLLKYVEDGEKNEAD